MKAKIFIEPSNTIEKSVNDWLGNTALKSCQGSVSFSQSETMAVMLVYEEETTRVGKVAKPGEKACLKCGSAMVRRERNSDHKPFWGCSAYPTCKNLEKFTAQDEAAELKRMEEAEAQVGPDDDDIPF